ELCPPRGCLVEHAVFINYRGEDSHSYAALRYRDSARDLDQVTPLLPGSPTCTVLVHQPPLPGRPHTARCASARPRRLPQPDAQDLLPRHLGSDRLAAEPVPIAEFLAVCAG